MIASLEERARQVRARAAVRAWEYRQRHFSKGVWFRLRRALADAEVAYAVSNEEVERLIAEGFMQERVGAELEPPKRIVFVPPERIASLHGKRVIALRLGPELLGERNVVLLRFR
jgi:hypothetical protein